MKDIKKIETTEYEGKQFRAITDFRVVAILLYNEIDCKGVMTPKENIKKKLFLFPSDERTTVKINSILNAFVNGKLTVEPGKLFGIMDRIKDVINTF